MAVRYSPYDYEAHENPYPIYAQLRAEAPLYFNEDLNFYAISRHADVSAAFRDTTRFSNAEGVSLDKEATGPHAYKTMSFLAMDPPRHTQLRAIVARGFTPRRVVELEPSIREIACEYLDRAEAGQPYDLIKDFAGRMPMDVISEMMGVPKADRDEIRSKSDLLVHREEGVEGVPQAGIEAAIELFGYYNDMVAERRKQRTDDLTSALIDAEIDGKSLDHDEIVAFLFLMVVAGNETTTKLLGNALYWAWRNPTERAKVWDGINSIDNWIEETLRYDTSTQVLARTVTEDVEIAGGVIPKGSRALLLVGSANRDETVFDDPDTYRIGRDTSQTMSFGMARHFCMGASLARLEARIGLEEFVKRFGDYELDEAGIGRVHSVSVRGFSTLPVTLSHRGA